MAIPNQVEENIKNVKYNLRKKNNLKKRATKPKINSTITKGIGDFLPKYSSLPTDWKIARGRGRELQVKNMTDQQKEEERAARLEKNRIAAKQCRKRRKDEMHNLIMENKNLRNALEKNNISFLANEEVKLPDLEIIEKLKKRNQFLEDKISSLEKNNIDQKKLIEIQSNSIQLNSFENINVYKNRNLELTTYIETLKEEISTQNKIIEALNRTIQLYNEIVIT